MSIAKPKVEFLGIVWCKGMLHIPTVRILAFKNMSVPRTPKKVKSFVCAMSYYRCFIPKFAKLPKPLMDLYTLHPSEFKWQEIHQKAFESIIDAIQTHTSLNYLTRQNLFLSKLMLTMLPELVEYSRKTTKGTNYLWPVFQELLPEQNANMEPSEKKSYLYYTI